MKQGIFISYRRETGDVMARLIYENLCKQRGYKCFLDVENDGATRFMMFDYLKPETTYYVMIEGGKAEYQISVSDGQ